MRALILLFLLYTSNGLAENKYLLIENCTDINTESKCEEDFEKKALSATDIISKDHRGYTVKSLDGRETTFFSHGKDGAAIDYEIVALSQHEIFQFAIFREVSWYPKIAILESYKLISLSTGNIAHHEYMPKISPEIHNYIVYPRGFGVRKPHYNPISYLEIHHLSVGISAFTYRYQRCCNNNSYDTILEANWVEENQIEIKTRSNLKLFLKKNEHAWNISASKPTEKPNKKPPPCSPPPSFPWRAR